MQGKLFIISGPSGAGKGTICKALLSRNDFWFSVSATTREPRPGEVDGVDYFYVSQERFDSMIENGELLEYVRKYKKSYGTPKGPMLEHLAAGQNVILEIEMIGAANVKKAYPEAVLIFVVPPSLECLHQRLVKRGSESEDQINVRTLEIKKELEEIEKYDYYVVNDDRQQAVEDTEAIIYGNGEQFRVTEGFAKAFLERIEEEYNALISRS